MLYQHHHVDVCPSVAVVRSALLIADLFLYLLRLSIWVYHQG